jgi:hypothetical protein
MGARFSAPSRPALGPTQPPIQWVPGHSRRVKRPGRGVDHPPPSSAEVKERVELYLYSPSGPSWPVLGWTFTFTLRVVLIRITYSVRILNFSFTAFSVNSRDNKGPPNLPLICSLKLSLQPPFPYGPFAQHPPPPTREHVTYAVVPRWFGSPGHRQFRTEIPSCHWWSGQCSGPPDEVWDNP